MTYKSLSLDIQDKIAHVQFIRPDQLNTMNTD
jgi:enoyl-CoA hydratase/carnithine racemase